MFSQAILCLVSSHAQSAGLMSIIITGQFSVCDSCHNWTHIGCTPFTRLEYSAMSKSSDDWYCSACLASIFPFNHFDNDIDFFFALYDFNFQGDFDTELLKQKKFNPFLDDSEFHREHKVGGGVGVYIQSHLKFNNALYESVLVEIIQPHRKNIIVGCFYRPPDASVADFNNSLEGILSTISFGNKLSYLMGVFNINILNSQSHQPSNESIKSYGI